MAALSDELIHLPEDDFRRERTFLPPSAFALYEGTGDEFTPTDLVSQPTWYHIMSLPDDVALLTSSHLGAALDRMHELDSTWLEYTYMEQLTGPYMSDAAIVAHEEFEALIFNALHGWYRQAIGCLRNAFEALVHAAALANRGDLDELRRWLKGEVELAVGRSLGHLHASDAGQALQAETGCSAFGRNQSDNSWLRRLYARLCGYAHSRAGSSNVDFWQSNGPVYVPGAVSTVFREFREVLASAYVLMRVGHPKFVVPNDAVLLFQTPDEAWSEAAEMILVKRLLE